MSGASAEVLAASDLIAEIAAAHKHGHITGDAFWNALECVRYYHQYPRDAQVKQALSAIESLLGSFAAFPKTGRALNVYAEEVVKVVESRDTGFRDVRGPPSKSVATQTDSVVSPRITAATQTDEVLAPSTTSTGSQTEDPDARITISAQTQTDELVAGAWKSQATQIEPISRARTASAATQTEEAASPSRDTSSTQTDSDLLNTRQSAATQTEHAVATPQETTATQTDFDDAALTNVAKGWAESTCGGRSVATNIAAELPTERLESVDVSLPPRVTTNLKKHPPFDTNFIEDDFECVTISNGRAIFHSRTRHRVQQAIADYKRHTRVVLEWVAFILKRPLVRDAKSLLLDFEQKKQSNSFPPYAVSTALLAAISLREAVCVWFGNLYVWAMVGDIDYANQPEDAPYSYDDTLELSILKQGTEAHEYFVSLLRKTATNLGVNVSKHEDPTKQQSVPEKLSADCASDHQDIESPPGNEPGTWHIVEPRGDSKARRRALKQEQHSYQGLNFSALLVEDTLDCEILDLEPVASEEVAGQVSQHVESKFEEVLLPLPEFSTTEDQGETHDTATEERAVSADGADEVASSKEVGQVKSRRQKEREKKKRQAQRSIDDAEAAAQTEYLRLQSIVNDARKAFCGEDMSIKAVTTDTNWSGFYDAVRDHDLAYMYDWTLEHRLELSGPITVPPRIKDAVAEHMLYDTSIINDLELGTREETEEMSSLSQAFCSTVCGLLQLTTQFLFKKTDQPLDSGLISDLRTTIALRNEVCKWYEDLPRPILRLFRPGAAGKRHFISILRQMLEMLEMHHASHSIPKTASEPMKKSDEDDACSTASSGDVGDLETTEWIEMASQADIGKAAQAEYQRLQDLIIKAFYVRSIRDTLFDLDELASDRLTKAVARCDTTCKSMQYVSKVSKVDTIAVPEEIRRTVKQYRVSGAVLLQRLARTAVTVMSEAEFDDSLLTVGGLLLQAAAALDGARHRLARDLLPPLRAMIKERQKVCCWYDALPKPIQDSVMVQTAGHKHFVNTLLQMARMIEQHLEKLNIPLEDVL